MKKIKYLILGLLVLAACSEDNAADSSSFGSDDAGQGGSLARFITIENWLYTVDETRLNVFDISNHEQPEYLLSTDIGFEIETLFSYGDQLYIGSRLGMYIYDISDRTRPMYLGEAQHLRSCDPVVSNGDYSFVTLHTNARCIGQLNQLDIYDTTDNTNPVLIDTIPLDAPKGLGLYNNYLFVTTDSGIVVFDISDPGNATVAHGISHIAFDVIIRGDHMFAVGQNGLKQFTLDPVNISQITELSTISY